MGGVYVSLPCLPPQYRSSLVTIFNALIFHSKDRGEYGNFAVFKPLIDELKHLETKGIELNLSGRKVQLYFKLASILGDILGLHSLLGFVESFRANFACRFCKMNRVQRCLATVEDSFFLGSKNSYEEDLKTDDMSLTGIKNECIFHQLSDFHVVANMSVDIMHDLFEHVCPTDMAKIIKHFIQEDLFTLTMLNNRLRAHDFGLIDSDNVPPVIQHEHLKNDNIKMSASEMWTFVKHFGIIIGDLIPEDNTVWRRYLNLRQILTLVTATNIQRECSSLLKTLVAEHHWLVRSVLKRDLKPTDHHLIHYPTVMDACGPLVFMWCMRFESKHRESKKIAVLTSNKVNLCKTIALRHQLKLAKLIYSGQLFAEVVQRGPTYTSVLRALSSSFDNTLEKNCQSPNTTINVCNWIDKNGSRYKAGLALCLGVYDDGPQFGVIKHVYVITDGTIFFLYQKINAAFNSHIDAYKLIDIDETCSIVSYENLINPHPIGLIKKGDHKYVVLSSYF